ncbi:DJ-1/PfpI family protein, partial [Patulibacter sp. S7RM1-6]
MTTAPIPSGPDVELLLFPGADELDVVGPLEVLAAAGVPVRPVVLPGTDPSLRTAHGLHLTADGELGARPDLLLVPGGGWLDGRPGVRDLVDDGAAAVAIAARHAAGTTVASVCTGALLLAAAGLLDDRPAVTNAGALDDLAARGVAVERDARVVDAGSVLTAGGPLAGVDLGLRLVERLVGPEAATAAA